MQFYIQNLTLFLLLLLSASVAICQSGAGSGAQPNQLMASANAEQKERPANSDAETFPVNASAPLPAARPASAAKVCNEAANVCFEGLSGYFGDFSARRTGECVIVKNVPVFSAIRDAEGEFGNRNGFFYLETGSVTDVGATFITSYSMSHQLNSFLPRPATKSLRLTAMLVDFRREFEVFRAPFAVQVEGLDENGQIDWTAIGTEPPQL
jgi:hypothetical protein